MENKYKKLLDCGYTLEEIGNYPEEEFLIDFPRQEVTTLNLDFSEETINMIKTISSGIKSKRNSKTHGVQD